MVTLASNIKLALDASPLEIVYAIQNYVGIEYKQKMYSCRMKKVHEQICRTVCGRCFYADQPFAKSTNRKFCEKLHSDVPKWREEEPGSVVTRRLSHLYILQDMWLNRSENDIDQLFVLSLRFPSQFKLRFIFRAYDNLRYVLGIPPCY